MGGGKTGTTRASGSSPNGVDPGESGGSGPGTVDVEPQRSSSRSTLSPTRGGLSRAVEASADAQDVADLFARLEACGQLVRLDPDVIPTMYHGATMTPPESWKPLRSVERSSELGHVRGDPTGTRSSWKQGTSRPIRRQLSSTARRSGWPRARRDPIFEPQGRVTLQCISGRSPTFERGGHRLHRGEPQRRRRSGSRKALFAPTDTLPGRGHRLDPEHAGPAQSLGSGTASPMLSAWLESSRLDIARGMFDKAADPRRNNDTITSLINNSGPASVNLERLSSAAAPA